MENSAQLAALRCLVANYGRLKAERSEWILQHRGPARYYQRSETESAQAPTGMHGHIEGMGKEENEERLGSIASPLRVKADRSVMDLVRARGPWKGEGSSTLVDGKSGLYDTSGDGLRMLRAVNW